MRHTLRDMTRADEKVPFDTFAGNVQPESQKPSFWDVKNLEVMIGLVKAGVVLESLETECEAVKQLNEIPKEEAIETSQGGSEEGQNR